jgi:L-asparaginase II
MDVAESSNRGPGASVPMTTVNLDVLVTRGDAVESRHAVSAAVVDACGELILVAGDSACQSPWRSCAKPLQVHPFVASGQLDAADWSTDELALACASHGGEPEHVTLAASMLASIGLTEADLACGPHTPLSDRGASLLQTSATAPTRLHNNCSGKHAAMLAASLANGWSSSGYDRPDHPLQLAIRAGLSRWTGLSDGAVDIATDGCGVPVFILGLQQMATAYSRLAVAARDEEAPSRILDAMATRPFLVGGTDRFDTELILATGGNVIAKVGAEGVHTVLIRDQGIGFAIKVADGASRAQHPAVLRLLQRLDALPAQLPQSLMQFAVVPVLDTRNAVVGQIRAAA